MNDDAKLEKVATRFIASDNDIIHHDGIISEILMSYDFIKTYVCIDSLGCYKIIYVTHRHLEDADYESSEFKNAIKSEFETDITSAINNDWFNKSLMVKCCVLEIKKVNDFALIRPLKTVQF